MIWHNIMTFGQSAFHAKRHYINISPPFAKTTARTWGKCLLSVAIWQLSKCAWLNKRLRRQTWSAHKNIIGQRFGRLAGPAILCIYQQFKVFKKNVNICALQWQASQQPTSQSVSVQSAMARSLNQSNASPTVPRSYGLSKPKSLQAKSSRQHRQPRRHWHGKAARRFYEIFNNLSNIAVGYDNYAIQFANWCMHN